MSLYLADFFQKCCTVHSRIRESSTVKDINQKNYFKDYVGHFRTENLFTIIRRYSSKRYFSFLYFHMKLSHHVVVRIYNHCRGWFKKSHTFKMKYFANEIHHSCLKRSPKYDFALLRMRKAYHRQWTNCKFVCRA